jgi:lambda family phage portal protein
MFRNDSIAHGVIVRIADNVTGPNGIMPQAKTASREWNQEAEQYFAEWCKIADYRRRVNFQQMQRQDVIALALAGESGAVFTDSGQLQQIEAERIKTPQDLVSDKRILDGVKLSNDGMPVGYYVSSRNESGYADGVDFELIKAADFVHFYDPHRIDQVRGVPLLAPCLNELRDLSDLRRSVLEKARLDSRNAWAIKTAEGPAKAMQLGPRRPGTAKDEPSDSQSYERFDGLRNYYLRPGEDVQSLASNTPNPQYMAFCKMYAQTIAQGLGIPYPIAMLDFDGSNFAVSRAALMIAYNRFEALQNIVIRKSQRVWNWRIAKAIKDGELPPAPTDSRGMSTWYKVEWARPRHEWIDPQAQIAAEREAIQLGVETWAGTIKKRGGDVEDTFRAKAAELKLIKDIGDEFGVDARDIADTSANPQRVVKNDDEEDEDEPKAEGLGKWLT